MFKNTLKGRYVVKNEEKYRGDVKNVIFRSSWEFQFCKILDDNPNVMFWNSEETVIQYISPIDNKPHRYFIDFTVKFNDGRILIIEIKPFAQTQEPTPPKRKTKKSKLNYAKAMKTYAINDAKWKAAKKFAEKNNVVFEIYTENELRKMGASIY